jgi:hypothetical protein
MTENEKHDETRPLSFYDEPTADETEHDEAAPEQTVRERAVAPGAYDEPTRRTHPLSVGYLVCGLVFLGIAASWALRQMGVIDSDGEQWVFPLVLVIAGAAGLLALVAKGMSGRKA